MADPRFPSRDARDTAIRTQAADWLLRTGPGTDPQVQAALDAWLAESEAHREAFSRVQRGWLLAGALRAASAGAAVAPRTARGRRRLPLLAAGLAACLLVLAIPDLLLRVRADHVTGRQELRRVELTDGSIVHLDAESAVAMRYGGGRRGVALLAGQAFFDVARMPESEFTVVAGDVTVRVTGTSFEVDLVADRVDVAVGSGSVTVEPENGDPVRLAPGDRATVARSGGVALSTLDPGSVGSWRDGRLVVDGARLDRVVEELRRHHTGLILLADPGLGARRVTGVFDLRRTEEALRTIAHAQGGSLLRVTPFLLVLSGG